MAGRTRRSDGGLNIKVRRGHPTGTYRRSGIVFSVLEAVHVPEDALTDEIRAEVEAEGGWLVLADEDDTVRALPEAPAEEEAPAQAEEDAE